MKIVVQSYHVQRSGVLHHEWRLCRPTWDHKIGVNTGESSKSQTTWLTEEDVSVWV